MVEVQAQSDDKMLHVVAVVGAYQQMRGNCNALFDNGHIINSEQSEATLELIRIIDKISETKLIEQFQEVFSV